MSAQSSKEEIVKRVQQRGADNLKMGLSNCAQSTIFALQEDFKALNDIPMEALTVLSGIALRGETCGAVIGGLLALGMLTGRSAEAFVIALGRGTRFCDAFEKEFGSLMCKQVHSQLLGKTYYMADLAQLEEFVEADGLTKCCVSVQTAARLVADIMLEEQA
jgi:C_GCAxxG_C_C family probable redox protein